MKFQQIAVAVENRPVHLLEEGVLVALVCTVALSFCLIGLRTYIPALVDLSTGNGPSKGICKDFLTASYSTRRDFSEERYLRSNNYKLDTLVFLVVHVRK